MDIQLKEDLIENQVNLLVAHDGVGVDIRRVECGLPERRAGRRRRGSLRPSSRTGRCGLRVRGRTSSRQTESAATGSAAIEVSAAGEQSLLLRGLQMAPVLDRTPVPVRWRCAHVGPPVAGSAYRSALQRNGYCSNTSTSSFKAAGAAST